MHFYIYRMKATTKFVISVVVLSAICAGLQVVWNHQMPAEKDLQNGVLLLGIFVATVTAIHLFLLKQSGRDGKKFISSFLAASVLKFFFYMLVLIVFLLLTQENKQTLILHFLFYYAVFTVLEVSMLYSELQKHK